MEDKTQYEALMEELKKLANNFRDVVTELGDILAKILPNIEIPDEEEDTWEMKCPYKKGHEYWLLDSHREPVLFNWNDCNFEKCYLKQGNTFKTKEAAELEAKRRNLLTRFRAFRDECNGDWKADWTNGFEDKFFISFNIFSDNIDVRFARVVNGFYIFGYFKNKEDAERAIELFGDEIKELFVEGDA